MQRGDVAKADDPLRVFFEFCQIDMIHNSGSTIAPPRAKDCLDAAAVERFLQVDEAFLVRSRQVAVTLAHDVVADHHFQIPLFKYAHCPGQYLTGNLAGWRHQRHTVASLEMSGSDHNRIRKKPRVVTGFWPACFPECR